VSETATDRLARMLALVPYISRRPGVAIAELATEFGVSTEQIGADLDLLMVCGLPGYYPDDLIDVVLDDDGGTVAIAFDAGIERPVRLTGDEAFALTVALRALAELTGLLDAESVHTALAKLEQASAAQSTGAADVVRVAAADPAPALGAVREALDRTRRLWIRYYTASRDAVSERTVDPLRLLVTDGHAYLEAYCHLAGSIRHFRVDRIEEVRILDEPAQPPLWVDSDVPERIFHPDPQVPPVTLRLARGARWVAEYYAMEETVELTDPPGSLRVRMRAAGDEWLARLVLSLGGQAVIEDAPELAALVARRAAEALTAYPAPVPATAAP
jgi:proteasome accessory factor C